MQSCYWIVFAEPESGSPMRRPCESRALPAILMTLRKSR